MLGANYPGTDWYERAYKLMGESPVEPIRALAPGETVVPATVRPTVKVLAPDDADPGATPKAEAPGAPTPATPSGGAGSTPGGTTPNPATPTGTTPGSPNG